MNVIFAMAVGLAAGQTLLVALDVGGRARGQAARHRATGGSRWEWTTHGARYWIRPTTVRGVRITAAFGAVILLAIAVAMALVGDFSHRPGHGAW